MCKSLDSNDLMQIEISARNEKNHNANKKIQRLIKIHDDRQISITGVEFPLVNNEIVNHI